jgi:hypothetical protein
MNSKNKSHGKTQKRLKFTREEDDFLLYLMQNFQNVSCNGKWKSVKEWFNKKFPASNRTNTQLRQHYQNSLMEHSVKGEFSLEEKELFEELRGKYHKSLPAIAKIMNRTISNVKNYNYRYFQPQNEGKSGIEFDLNEIEREMSVYQNDFEFCGIESPFEGM